jgi:uncharacterized protein DUF4255
VSNFLAIATVTAAVRQIILDAVRKDVTGGPEVHVTHVRPGGEAPQTPDTGVNVFLYGVGPNAALRNADLPTRRQNGQAVDKPQVALDLHYLLTFYGDDSKLETQRLAGSVVRTLHAAPTLPRAKLKEVIAASAFLTGSDMEDAIEAVRLTPLALSLEELSKLWSILFQTPYALSAAYQASVVVIEGTETPQPGLPVRARTVLAVPFTLPRIDAVADAEGPIAPITPASTLVLTGTGLRGDHTRVRLRDRLADATTIGPHEVTIDLAAVPAPGVRAGIQGVQVVHDRLLGAPPTYHHGDESNVAPFALRPVVGGVTHHAGPPATLDVDVTPEVGQA